MNQNVKQKQYQLIKKLNIPLLRETINQKFECKCVNEQCKSKQGARKGGFFWSNEKNSYFYHCFKCGLTLPLVLFLKQYFQEEYISIQIERQGRINDHVQQIIPTIKISNEQIKQFIQQLFETKQIVPFNECNDDEVINYVTNRQIPSQQFHRLFVADNFFNIHQQIKTILEIHKGKQFELKEEKDKRLMWMFKNHTGDIIAVQGRRVDKKEPRYIISRFNADEHRLIGGMEYMSTEQQLFIVEGFIDSLFLPNAVSLNGLHLPTITHLVDNYSFKRVTIVFDNEENDQIKKNINMLSEYTVEHPNVDVCLLPHDMRQHGKDINDYIKNGFSREQIIDTINSNCYQGTSLKVRGILW